MELCPKRWEDGPCSFTPGPDGEPGWCWFCERPMSSFVINFDGACWPNPGGKAGYGAIICRDDIIIAKISGSIPAGETSNNVAEYAALIAALTWILDNGFDQEIIEARGDSMLVIKQMWGWPAGRKWKIKRGLYFDNAMKAKELLAKFSSITGKWVPREQNTDADYLSRGEGQ